MMTVEDIINDIREKIDTDAGRDLLSTSVVVIGVVSLQHAADVSMSVSGLPLEEVVNYIARQTGCRCGIRDGRVQFTFHHPLFV